MMKFILILIGLMGLLVNCHQVKPQEVAATIIEFTMPPSTVFCACCAGYQIQIGTKYYYANTIPAAYDKANNPVWLRYKDDTNRCAGVEGRIEIISIRSR